jgi:hypothetical protein
MTRPANNNASPHRPAPPCPPIDPALVYPWRRLADWGFGARGVAALQRAGLPAMQFGKQKFFLGAALILVLQNGAPQSETLLESGEAGR